MTRSDRKTGRSLATVPLRSPNRRRRAAMRRFSQSRLLTCSAPIGEGVPYTLDTTFAKDSDWLVATDARDATDVSDAFAKYSRMSAIGRDPKALRMSRSETRDCVP